MMEIDDKIREGRRDGTKAFYWSPEEWAELILFREKNGFVLTGQKEFEEGDSFFGAVHFKKKHLK